MKRFFDCTVVDSDEEETKRARHDSDTLRVETPAHHHDIHPSLLSPFKEGVPDEISYPKGDIISVRDYYKSYIERTEEECHDEGCAPQRSLKWKEARKFALTASDFGAAAGDNPYSSPDDLVKKKLWSSFKGNDATKWGSFCEPKAAEAFLLWAKEMDPEAKLHEFNLTKFQKTPWLAVSPDGVLEYTLNGKKQYDLVEYKCPSRFSESHPYAKYKNNTPNYYYDQMLGIWGLVNEHGGFELNGEKILLTRAWFVVWQPRALWITSHDFLREEYEALFQKLRVFYFGKFLPVLVWYHNGMLDEGEVIPHPIINITNVDHSESTEVHDELVADDSGGST